MRLQIWNLHIASDHLHLERQWIEVYRRCDSILSLLGTETLFSSNQANHSTQRLQQFLLGCDKSHANLFIHLVGVLHCTQNISLMWWWEQTRQCMMLSENPMSSKSYIKTWHTSHLHSNISMLMWLLQFWSSNQNFNIMFHDMCENSTVVAWLEL